MARGRKLKRGGAAKAADETTEPKAMEESVETQSEEVAADVSTPEEAVEAPDEVKAETVEGAATEAPSDNTNAEGEMTPADQETPKKQRKRQRGKKNKTSSGNTPVPEEKITDLAGLIFMCNSETKKDCFKYRVFGLPEAKRNLVEQVKKGTKLFLFDIDKKVLHGVYKASSEGGMNLIEEAFKDSSRKFPAQVRFRIQKDCMPLDEGAFKIAIKDNYVRANRFKCELNSEQVGRLIKLFRPLDSRGLPEPKPSKEAKKDFTPKGKLPRGPPPRSLRNRGPPPRFSGPAPPRERVYKDYAPQYSRERHASEIIPPSYALVPDVAHAEAELLRQRHLRQVQEEALDRRAYLLDPVVEASIARKRYLEDVYLAEQQALAKRPLLPEVYRDLEYQREAPYRGYADGLHALPSAALPYDPRGY
ncbi:hypothetical protein GOP47_0021720 [Adiantum capillus-veneris]|uniref:DCD domain-containing protein n=1 Tax=Adiantum capillus-veneris TaxID=13818 RepID=A0A9D4Z5I0_ADICA|nr:hypothetical protein GOP47_0021720 [Adiantum capillus-veneris]